MKKLLILTVAVLGMAMIGFSQERKFVMYKGQKVYFPEAQKSPIACDCDKSIMIPLDYKGSYGPTIAPKGFGNVQEVKSSKKDDIFFFENEHNSAWYYFDIKHDGELVFEISPENKTDDYDFLLFRSSAPNFCENLKNGKIFPIRTNISHPSNLVGKTGLSDCSSKEFVHSGPGENFSKPIKVKKNERYYLVIDNIAEDGRGHTVSFNYLKKVHLSGQVLNESSTPVKAEISLSDSKGEDLKKVATDDFGKYDFTVKVFGEAKYNLTIYSNNYFIDVQEVSTMNSDKDVIFTDIKTILPILRGGSKYQFKGICFFGGSVMLTPTSYSSLNALFKLMKNNPNMIIRIEGHMNVPGNTSEVLVKDTFWELSEGRSMTIYNYLISKGINKKRMSTIGFGSTKMLFPNPQDEKEQAANRRVEINVISF